MNQKIECLINGGFVSLEDVLEYAQQYMNGVDQYDDAQIDKYYQEQYPEEFKSSDVFKKVGVLIVLVSLIALTSCSSSKYGCGRGAPRQTWNKMVNRINSPY